MAFPRLEFMMSFRPHAMRRQCVPPGDVIARPFNSERKTSKSDAVGTAGAGDTSGFP
jgi:hypothetical protein